MLEQIKLFFPICQWENKQTGTEKTDPEPAVVCLIISNLYKYILSNREILS